MSLEGILCFKYALRGESERCDVLVVMVRQNGKDFFDMLRPLNSTCPRRERERESEVCCLRVLSIRVPLFTVKYTDTRSSKHTVE